MCVFVKYEDDCEGVGVENVGLDLWEFYVLECLLVVGVVSLCCFGLLWLVVVYCD